ncbi:type VII secretion protein EccE [Actinoplanes sp. DH11]|uniref:type VII secretion protein EccE n=1 Tax=Actinoplanes sp. DH11 TaxID=2857011 RepID=UPI001E471C95|nr:type VII secretion protein EccE [Actinoplanes sp. DH11]
MLALTWVRVRDRWAFQWFGVRVRFVARRRTTRLGAPFALLASAAPRTRLTSANIYGEPVAVLVGDRGSTVLLELGRTPALETLLTGNDPSIHLQLILTGMPAPGLRTDPAATSYRALNPEDSLAQFRAVLAIRVPHDSAEPLPSAVRKMVRKLRDPDARLLDEASAVRATSDLAHAGGHPTLSEQWHGITVGGQQQATFRCDPGPGTGITAHLLSRLLHTPATASTVALTPEAGTFTLLTRLAAPDEAALDQAAQALHQILASERMTAHRLDGAHLPALTATLPLAVHPATLNLTTHPGPPAGTSHPGGPSPALRPHDPSPADRHRPPPHPRPGDTSSRLGDPALPALDHGVLLGRNRHDRPVLARLFRPRHTTAVLVAGPRCTQLIAFRALGAGARVVVRTNHPATWAPLRHALGGDDLFLQPGTARSVPGGSPLRPTLLIDETTAHPDPRALPAPPSRPPASDSPAPPADLPWVTTMTVLDRADADTAASADLLLLQPLTEAEAAVVGSAVALGSAADLLPRMPPGMIAVISDESVRWAALSPTSVEKVLIGHPAQRNIGGKSPLRGSPD